MENILYEHFYVIYEVINNHIFATNAMCMLGCYQQAEQTQFNKNIWNI